jgi:hypothetical protein
VVLVFAMMRVVVVCVAQTRSTRTAWHTRAPRVFDINTFATTSSVCATAKARALSKGVRRGNQTLRVGALSPFTSTAATHTPPEQKHHHTRQSRTHAPSSSDSFDVVQLIGRDFG